MYLVLFDCDGTLVDSQAMIVAAMEHGFRDNGLEPPTRADTLSIVGLSLPIAIGRLARGVAAERQAAIVASYSKAFQRLRAEPVEREPLFPGTRAALERLAARDDVLLGVATGKSRRGLDAVLARHDLAGFFVTLQTADDAPSKPDPTMVRRALVETGVAAARTVLVGDTTFDMEMARAAGIAGLGVSWGYHPAGHLGAAGAGRIVDGFAEVPVAVADLLGWPVEDAA